LSSSLRVITARRSSLNFSSHFLSGVAGEAPLLAGDSFQSSGFQASARALRNTSPRAPACRPAETRRASLNVASASISTGGGAASHGARTPRRRRTYGLLSPFAHPVRAAPPDVLLALRSSKRLAARTCWFESTSHAGLRPAARCDPCSSIQNAQSARLINWNTEADGVKWRSTSVVNVRLRGVRTILPAAAFAAGVLRRGGLILEILVFQFSVRPSASLAESKRHPHQEAQGDHQRLLAAGKPAQVHWAAKAIGHGENRAAVTRARQPAPEPLHFNRSSKTRRLRRRQRPALTGLLRERRQVEVVARAPCPSGSGCRGSARHAPLPGFQGRIPLNTRQDRALTDPEGAGGPVGESGARPRFERHHVVHR